MPVGLGRVTVISPIQHERCYQWSRNGSSHLLADISELMTNLTAGRHGLRNKRSYGNASVEVDRQIPNDCHRQLWHQMGRRLVMDHSNLAFDSAEESLSSSRSRVGPLHHRRMTLTDCTSPADLQVGDCCWNQSDPATYFFGALGTFPRAIRKTSKRDVDPTLKSLMCLGVFPEPGYVTKHAAALADY